MPNDRITKYGAVQAVAEVSVGSLVHAFHVPLGGHVLSLNQALVLTFACRGVPSRREGVQTACGASNVAAALKSLSPAGAKLSPMLAICVQGVLYAVGVGLAGANALGAVLGAMLLSLWAFLHPLLMAYFIFGSRFFDAVEKLWRQLASVVGWQAQTGVWILVAFVGLKLCLAAAAALVGWFSSSRLEARYLAYLEKHRKAVEPKPAPSVSSGVVRDLLNPLFLASLAVSVGFFIVGRNATWTQAILYLLRILAVAVLVFWMLRTPWVARRAQKLLQPRA